MHVISDCILYTLCKTPIGNSRQEKNGSKSWTQVVYLDGAKTQCIVVCQACNLVRVIGGGLGSDEAIGRQEYRSEERLCAYFR